MKNISDNVLIIDDDDIFHFIAADYLQTHHPELDIIGLQSAAKAMFYLENCPARDYPKLIICDLKMPVMDGFDFLEDYDSKIYPSRSQIPVVILSSTENKTEQAKLGNYRCFSEFIMKTTVEENLRYLLIKYMLR